ncbi:MAG: head-tail adaptor protein, partial [Planctomycetaceae bacterium]|nr:head-tail adaptor protein [Planctomycetaceae bacterium]
AIKTRGGRESYRFNQVQAEVSHLFEFRWDSLTKDVGPSWRIKHDERYFDITAAYDVDEQHAVVRCECVEQV